MKVSDTQTKPRKMQPAFVQHGSTQLVKALFAAARVYNPAINGLTNVTPTHAVMQAMGDTTYYVVEINASQARQLGYVA